MSNDPDIHSALKRGLNKVSNDSVIPDDTLRRAKRRRNYAMTIAALGGVASALVIFLGSQVIESPKPNVDLAPVSTPSPGKTATPRPDQNQEQPNEPGDSKAPPTVTVSSTDRSIELSAWSYCYKNRCVSGSPGPNPPDVGSPDEVAVEFPLPDWSFTAIFTPAGQQCGRQQQVPLEPTGDGDFVLRPAGYADTYDVTLFGTGGGDLSVTFRWTTPEDGPLPEPKAHAAIITDQNGRPYSYGVELELINLAETPEQASAMITVEAKDGNSITFEAKRTSGRCWPEGTVYWRGPDDKGLEAAELGEGPFVYTVELTLDGKRYIGTGTWPADEIRGNEPSISLEFSPDLPGLR